MCTCTKNALIVRFCTFGLQNPKSAMSAFPTPTVKPILTHTQLNFKGNWLTGARLVTWRAVTVKITDGWLTIIADNNDMQELREQLY